MSVERLDTFMEIIKTTIPILDNYIAWEMSPHSAQAMRHTNYPHTIFFVIFYNYLETAFGV